MEQKGMSVSVRALLAAVLFLATSCTTGSADGAPPPVARTPDEAIVSVAGPVPADRWRAGLIAGDDNSPAFYNGVEAMRDQLADRGVRNVRSLPSHPVARPSLDVSPP